MSGLAGQRADPEALQLRQARVGQHADDAVDVVAVGAGRGVGGPALAQIQVSASAKRTSVSATSEMMLETT